MFHFELLIGQIQFGYFGLLNFFVFFDFVLTSFDDIGLIDPLIVEIIITFPLDFELDDFLALFVFKNPFVGDLFDFVELIAFLHQLLYYIYQICHSSFIY